ncbi:hypothetical protein [Hahella chejuensis]|uniref:hypothetical protein n=1 Tax=Hahella chejuensis TaxID=158327 RepID=UPI003B75C802
MRQRRTQRHRRRQSGVALRSPAWHAARGRSGIITTSEHRLRRQRRRALAANG